MRSLTRACIVFKKHKGIFRWESIRWWYSCHNHKAQSSRRQKKKTWETNMTKQTPLIKPQTDKQKNCTRGTTLEQSAEKQMGPYSRHFPDFPNCFFFSSYLASLKKTPFLNSQFCTFTGAAVLERLPKRFWWVPTTYVFMEKYEN